MSAIEVCELRRVFKARMGILRRRTKEVLAVDGISFEVGSGELFGLVGPNGAGKTTTVKMLTTLLLPSSGSAQVLGLDVVKQAEALRSRIGFVLGGERGLYWRLSAQDNLRYFASLYQMDPARSDRRIAYLLDLVGLRDRADEKVEGFSRGMKQKLHIARTLLHDPEMLFLDEPSIGLDPVSARDMRRTIRDLQAEKKTILLTTHQMYEADALCQRVAVINHGRIVALDSPSELKKTVKDLSVIELEVFGIPPDMLSLLRTLPLVESVSVENRDQTQVLLIQSPQASELLPRVIAALQGLRIEKTVVREPTLEDAYVRLVGGTS